MRPGKFELSSPLVFPFTQQDHAAVFTLRHATRDDIPAICDFSPDPMELFRFFPQAHHPLTPEQMVEGPFRHRSDQTLLLWDDQPTGYADIYDLQPGKECFIGHVIVDRTCRGRGAGRFLVEGMIRIARERHQVPLIRLSCFSDNTPALLLYHELGFRPQGMEVRLAPQGSRLVMLHLERQFSV
ncbi:MAG: GNAT family N-acetyltransferase [Magnetococcus sp. DMHC-1]|nr:GNAT family N-acetyltransferase [Magnetococcales bacterium]